MASAPLSSTHLPSESELRSFARATAHLLSEQQTRTSGSRIVRRTAGVGIQHLDHRDYAAGDEVRHIDWRQTARRRRPIVRRFESESVSDCAILIDASSSMAVHGAVKWHASLCAAAAMSYALLELGHRVGVIAFGDSLVAECPRGRGQHHYAAIARLFGTLRPSPGVRSDVGACARRIRDGAWGFVISDFLAKDEMRGGISAVLDRCTSLHALQVTHSAELSLPAFGDLDLIDVETGERMPVRADESVGAVAAAERAAMTHRLRNFCVARGIPFTDWNVARPWQQTLITHLVRARSVC